MFGRGKQQLVVIRELSRTPLPLNAYQEIVALGLDESDLDLEEAQIIGNARYVEQATAARDLWRDRRDFLECVEKYPDTPVRWNRW